MLWLGWTASRLFFYLLDQQDKHIQRSPCGADPCGIVQSVFSYLPPVWVGHLAPPIFHSATVFIVVLSGIGVGVGGTLDGGGGTFRGICIIG